MGSSDFLTETFGPGVVGTLLALLIFAGFGGLYFIVFDKATQGGEERIEVAIANDARTIQDTKEAIQTAQTQLNEIPVLQSIMSKISKAEAMIKQQGEQISGLQQRIEENTGIIEGVGRDYAEYQVKYREAARATLVGKSYPELHTESGKVYKDVKVNKVDPLRMGVRYAGGIASIDLVDLPSDMREFLQIDEEERDQHKARESRVAQQAEQSGKQGQVLKELQQLRYQRDELDTKVAATQGKLDQSEGAIKNLNAQLLAKQSELNRQAQASISQAPQIRADIAKIQASLERFQKSIPQWSDEVREGKARLAELEARINELRNSLSGGQ